MNVKELKKALSKYPDDIQVVLSTDEEGNGFSEIYNVAESMWFGDEIYVMEEFIGTMGYTEEDRAPEGAVPVIVLWP